MRSIDEIIADTQKTSETALREAFEAGRSTAAAELKAKLSAFFSEIIAPFEAHETAAPSTPVEEPATAEHADAEHETAEHSDIAHQSAEHPIVDHHENGHYN